MKDESELLRTLAEAEGDVVHCRVAPMQNTESHTGIFRNSADGM